MPIGGQLAQGIKAQVLRKTNLSYLTNRETIMAYAFAVKDKDIGTVQIFGDKMKRNLLEVNPLHFPVGCIYLEALLLPFYYSKTAMKQVEPIRQQPKRKKRQRRAATGARVQVPCQCRVECAHQYVINLIG